MKVNFFKTIILGSILFSGAFFSCKDQEIPSPRIHPSLDSLGVNINLDLTISGILDNDETIQFSNGINGYANKINYVQDSVCLTTDSGLYHIEKQQFIFLNPLQSKKNKITVSFEHCLWENEIATGGLVSFLEPNEYTFIEDIYPNKNGVVVKFIDEFGEEWSSLKGSNTGINDKCKVSAIIQNQVDEFSSHIIFGKFTCKVYRNDGSFRTFRNVNFKSRIANN